MQPGSPAVSAGLSARCPELPQVLTCQYMGRSRIYEPLAIERLAEEGRRDVHQIFVDRLELADGFVQRNADDLVSR